MGQLKEKLSRAKTKAKKGLVIGATVVAGVAATPKQANADTVIIKQSPRVVHVVRQPKVVVHQQPVVVVKETPAPVVVQQTVVQERSLLGTLAHAAARVTDVIVHHRFHHGHGHGHRR